MNPVAIRLLNQQLIAQQFSTPTEVVRYMGAMQAQEYRMMRWAVAMRTRRPSFKAFKSRDIVLPPEQRHHAHNNSGIFQPIIAYDGKICGNWSPFKEDFHSSFFEENFESEDVSEAWQSYNSYRNK